MLQAFAWLSLGIAFLCAAMITLHEIRHPQKMMVMNLVWPLTALYLSVFGLFAYFRFGVPMARSRGHHGEESQMDGQMKMEQRAWPTLVDAAISATHCGAGCVLGDIVSEFAVFASGAMILGSMLWASFVWDFVAAWCLGIAFQYFTIVPMRKLSPMEGLKAAAKADTLSIIAFQVGMYGWMLLVHFRLFPESHLGPDEAVYWLMMQVAMICGFVTSIPMNWWLLKIGWKESMS
ncbi:MAG TPA: DUF4396 domain-containing protein [Edaphobacter sp.]|jgi:hypothetical protein